MPERKRTTNHYRNGKKRNRKLRRKLSKKRLLSDKQTSPKAGKITEYIQQFDPERHQHYKFMIVVRVSTWKQVELGYLDNQLKRMKKFAEDNGLNALIDICIVCSAFWSEHRKEIALAKFQTDPELYPFDPRSYDKPHYFNLEEMLVPIMKSAKDGAFLFESACRAIRSDEYSKGHKDAPISEDELKEFAAIVGEIPVITICHPEATFQEVQSWRISQDALIDNKLNKSAGWTKRRYKKHHDKVIELRRATNSYGKIAKQLNLPIELVRSWCRKAKQKGLL